DPALANEEAHGPLEHEEDVVLGVGVGPGPLRVGLEPPLGDRVPLSGLLLVGLEARLHPPHPVAAPLPGPEHDGCPGRLCVVGHRSSLLSRERWADQVLVSSGGTFFGSTAAGSSPASWGHSPPSA